MFKRKGLALLLAVAMVVSMLPSGIGATKKVEAASWDAETAGRRVVGYFPSYRIGTLNSIDFSAMTHCNLSFMTYANGTLTSGFSSGDVQNIVSKCHANNCKALIAIGGWNGISNDGMFSTAAKRTSFVDQAMNYVETYNLDGVDLDIELTDADIWNNFEALASELAGRLHAKGKILTMAVSTWFTDGIPNNAYNYIDFLNLMSYDYNQSGTGDHAPWSQVYDMLNYYQARGVSKDKLVIGVPFYGYASGGVAKTFAEIVAMNASYAYQDYANGIYYNGINTIKEKTEYSKSYGGIMTWEVGQDSFGQYSLLNVMKTTMASGVSSSETTAQETTTQQTSTKDWNSASFVANGSGNSSYDNAFKFYCSNSKVSVVNVQQPEFASEAGIYVTFPAGISSCSLSSGSYAIQGAGIILYGSAFANQTETEFTVTDAEGTYTCYVYNAKAGSQQETTAAQETTTQSSGGTVSGSYDEWSATAVYTQGMTVQYNGNVYEAQWWTQGNNPETGNDGVWKLIGTVSEEETTTQQETTTQEETTTQVIVHDAYSKIEAENFDSKSGMVIDSNSNVSNGQNLGGVTNGTYAQYNKVSFSENAAAISITYSSKSGDAQGNVEVYVDSWDNKVGTLTAANTGSDWSNYTTLEGKLDTPITAGTHAIYLKFVTTGSAGYVCNLDYFTFIKASEYVEPVQINISSDIEINGFQISTTAEGIRTVYSAGNTVEGDSVSEIGLVYALKSGSVEDDDIYVGSTNSMVASYKATEAGKLSSAVSKDNSYTMTMLFGDDKTSSNFNKIYAVRVYAKLSDGSYVYTSVKEYSIYSIADKLYKNNLMTTFASHNYLYDSVLKVVDSSYAEVDFEWKNSLAKPSNF